LKESQGISHQPFGGFFHRPPSTAARPMETEAATLLGVPVKSIDDMRSFPRLKGSMDTPDWQSGRLDIPLALALMETEAITGVNFSTERSTIQHYWSEYRKKISS
jgi:general secretion pathway protein L